MPVDEAQVGDLRVLVIADDPLARTGLSMLLSGEPGCLVIGQVESEHDLDEAWATFQPDVLLWDLGWEPDLETMDEQIAFLAEDTAWPALLLVPDEDLAGPAWGAGARAVLRRDANPAAIAAALRGVVQGLLIVDPAFRGLLVAPVVPTSDLVEELTPRELEVLQLVAEGLANRAIGQRLNISPHTVKFHLNALMGKLEAQSRTEAVVRATRLGLIML